MSLPKPTATGSTLRLPNRILGMKPAEIPRVALEKGTSFEQCQNKAAVEVTFLERATVVCVDEIAKWYARHTKGEWSILSTETDDSDFPLLTPPFEALFVHWHEPRDWNINGEAVRSEGYCEAGVLALTFHPDKNRDALAWTQLISNSPVDKPNPHVAEAIPLAKWVIAMSPWMASTLTQGRPMWMGYYAWVFLDHAGAPFQMIRTGPTVRFFEATGAAGMMSIFHVASLSIYFMHCKNIKVHPAEEDLNPPAKWLRRTKSPSIRYYTLDIVPFKEVLEREGSLSTNGARKALHICRGHFATYTANSPLFGKYVGTFFKPQHVRGAEVAGRVEKSYRVREPSR